MNVYRVLIASDVFTIATLGCTKTSALFFYHRIFCVRLHGRSDVFETLVIISVTIVILWTIAYDLLSGLCNLTVWNTFFGSLDKPCRLREILREDILPLSAFSNHIRLYPGSMEYMSTNSQGNNSTSLNLF